MMKNGKWHMTEEIDLPNQDKIRTLGEMETYKYLGILEANTVKHAEMKENTKKEILLENEKTIWNWTRRTK